MDDELKNRIKEKIRQDLANREHHDKEREKRIKLAWDNLKPLRTPEDVPNIPQVPKDEYQTFYVPRLIAAGAIPKKDLEHGEVYLGKHRRCREARWNQKLNKFEYWRWKFGAKTLDTCNHFEDDDGFALFVPIRKIILAFD